MVNEKRDLINTIRLTETQEAELEKIAKKYYQDNQSATIRMIIDKFIEQEKKEEKYDD